MTVEEKELSQVEGKRFANKKFFGKDFSNLDLSNSDFRSATLIDCNFTGSDLSRASFRDANCYGANFTDTILYKTSFENAVLAHTTFAPKRLFGITVTLTCDTFDKMKVSRTSLLYWLFLASMMEPPDGNMHNRILASIGAEEYTALQRVFKEEILK